MEGRSAIFARALNKSLEIFVSDDEEDISDVMSNGLKPIAEAVDLDRIIVYRLLDIDSRKRFGQVYRWVKTEGGTASLDNELKILPDYPAIQNWSNICIGGGYVNVHASAMSEHETAFLGGFGVKSMLLTPVFIKGGIWGAVAFQDHTNERIFDEATIEFLFSAARVCTNTVIRAEKTRAADEAAKSLKRSKDLTDTLNKMAALFLSQSGKSFEDMMSVGIKLLADLIGLDRVSVFRNFKMADGLHASQIYRWDRVSGGTTRPTSAYTDIAYKKFAPDWDLFFRAEKSINSPVRLMTGPEAVVLNAAGTISAFAAPVFINDAVWGFTLFEDRQNERVFDDDLAEMMRSAAFLCANTVIHAEMEREIITEKDLTHNLIDSASVGLFIFDENFKVIDCNNAIINMFGSGTKQYFIEHFYDHLPEYQPDGLKSIDKAESILKQAFNGEKLVFEWVHCSLENVYIPCEVTLTRVKYNNKYRVLAYIYDLRNIKKMEKAAAEAELTQVLIDSMPLSCVLIDRDYNIITCNNEAVNFFGLTDKEELLNSFYDLSPEYQPCGRNSKEMASEVIGKAFEKILYQFEWIHQKPDGESMPAEITLVQVMYKGQNAIAGYIRDLRAYKTYLAEIKKAQENLRLMRDTAETANKTKSIFLANMSHEMRTPMNVIVGLTDLMLEEDSTPKNIKETLTKINTAGNTLMGLINDVLDISKIEAGKLELMPVQYETASFLNDIITLNMIRIEEKPITFELDIHENLPSSLSGDDLRVKQIFNNLLSNAFKYTNEGSITLGVSCSCEGDSVWVSFYVSDTGIGIRKEDLAKIFSDYNQVDTRANRAIEGTGLGLSITKKLVELMDGKITVESEYGKGSIFHACIRQGFVTNTTIGKETIKNLSSFRYSDKKKLTHGKLLRPNLSYARVLLVDDLPTNLDVAAGMLGKYKMQVDCLTNGQDAINCISEGEPVYSVIFMDHMMPGMDGIEATKAIRALDTVYAKNIPIIALTANAVAGNEQMFLDNGFNAFLPKPFNVRLLDSIIQRWVRDKSRE